MRFLYLIIVTFLANTGFSQISLIDKNKEEPKLLSQPDKTVKEIQVYKKNPIRPKNATEFGMLREFARYNEDGKITEYHQYHELGFLSKRYKYFYGKDNSIEVNKYGAVGKLKYKWLYTSLNVPVEEIKYNRKGKIKHKWIYRSESGKIMDIVNVNPKNDTIYNVELTYNNNQLKSVKKYKKNKLTYSQEYLYDDQDRKIEAVTYESEKEIIDWLKISYTEKGDTSSIIKYDKKGKMEEAKYFSYNSDGLLVNYKDYNLPDETRYEWKYFYDEKNNQVEEKYFEHNQVTKFTKNKFKNNQLNGSIIYNCEHGNCSSLYGFDLKEYKYDKKGNLMEYRTLNEKSIPKNIVRKVYFYF